MKLTTTTLNKDIIDSIVIPRLKHMVSHHRFYKFSVTSGSYMGAARIGNNISVRVTLEPDTFGFRFLRIIMNYGKLGDINESADLNVKVEEIHMPNLGMEIDETHRLIMRFCKLCDESETQQVIKRYKMIFDGITNEN